MAGNKFKFKFSITIQIYILYPNVLMIDNNQYTSLNIDTRSIGQKVPEFCHFTQANLDLIRRFCVYTADSVLFCLY
eukprot:SAG31_NODE_4450_length_3221_cov_2.819987_1_plen_76_part_00